MVGDVKVGFGGALPQVQFADRKRHTRTSWTESREQEPRLQAVHELGNGNHGTKSGNSQRYSRNGQYTGRRENHFWRA